MALINFNKILTWADFPNSLPAGKSEDARISVSWKLDADEFQRKGNAIVIGNFTVEIFLVPDTCGVVRSVVSGDRAVAEALLKHEQGHYDIIALGAREFHKKAAALSAPTEQELNNKLDKLQEEMTKKADEVDARYDIQTNHSRNKQKQQEWERLIAAEKQKTDGSVSNLP